MKTLEPNNLTYTKRGGLLYPSIKPPTYPAEEIANLGRYGKMALEFLMENSPSRCELLLMTGRLIEKMTEVDGQAWELIDRLEEDYIKNHKPNDPRDTMEVWQLRETARRTAEETAISQVVMRYN